MGLKYAGGRTDPKIASMIILMVDDHVLIREALRGVLKEVKGDAAVLEAPNCRQAMQLISEHPDIGLILFDLNLPNRDGFTALAEFHERSCLAFSQSEGISALSHAQTAIDLSRQKSSQFG